MKILISHVSADTPVAGAAREDCDAPHRREHPARANTSVPATSAALPNARAIDRSSPKHVKDAYLARLLDGAICAA